MRLAPGGRSVAAGRCSEKSNGPAVPGGPCDHRGGPDPVLLRSGRPGRTDRAACTFPLTIRPLNQYVIWQAHKARVGAAVAPDSRPLARRSPVRRDREVLLAAGRDDCQAVAAIRQVEPAGARPAPVGWRGPRGHHRRPRHRRGRGDRGRVGPGPQRRLLRGVRQRDPEAHPHRPRLRPGQPGHVHDQHRGQRLQPPRGRGPRRGPRAGLRDHARRPGHHGRALARGPRPPACGAW